ncbi:MAG TPA: hypothetical protein VNZ66_00115 [Aeromicrobium sp.]|nr:hypothetical protein [Aeromicrobium sp.]
MGWGGRARDWGGRANDAAHGLAQNIDDQTGEHGERLAKVLVVAVRLLRIPTAILWTVPLPFIAACLVLGIVGEGWFGTVLIVAGALMASVSALFWGRRRRIIRAVQEPELLGGELRTLFNLTSKFDDASGTLRELTAGDGWRVFGRLRAAWRGASLPAQWVGQVAELPRARYFAPPKIGTTTTLTVAALWLVPISIVLAVFAVIGSIAGSL